MKQATQHLLVRRVKVDRTLDALAAITAVHQNWSVFYDHQSVEALPTANEENVEILLFKLSRKVNRDKLNKAYDRRGLKPVDPAALAKLNEYTPTLFSPNVTHWKDGQGNWHYASFGEWYQTGLFSNRGSFHKEVSGYRFRTGLEREWDKDWWFAGVRK